MTIDTIMILNGNSSNHHDVGNVGARGQGEVTLPIESWLV